MSLRFVLFNVIIIKCCLSNQELGICNQQTCETCIGKYQKWDTFRHYQCWWCNDDKSCDVEIFRTHNCIRPKTVVKPDYIYARNHPWKDICNNTFYFKTM